MLCSVPPTIPRMRSFTAAEPRIVTAQTDRSRMSCAKNGPIPKHLPYGIHSHISALLQMKQLAALGWAQDCHTFVGITEQMSLMAEAWAEKFGVTTELPPVGHNSPGQCQPGDPKCTRDAEKYKAKAKKILSGPLALMRRQFSYDTLLWCDAIEQFKGHVRESGMKMDAEFTARPECAQAQQFVRESRRSHQHEGRSRRSHSSRLG